MNTSAFFGHSQRFLIHCLAVMLVALALGSGCASSENEYGNKINEAAASGNFSKSKALLKANPRLVFTKGKYGYTPLHWAASEGHRDVAELLLTCGADVDATNDIGETPLHVAANRGRTDVAGLLLVNNADVNAKNHFEPTPMHLAACQGHRDVAELLLAHGAEVDIYDAAKVCNADEVAALLKANPGLVSSKDYKYGRTPLHWAALYGNRDVVELLLAKGANVNATDDDRMTPLHLVAKNDRKETSKLILEMAKLLLASNADVNAVDSPFGDTPLHKAAGGSNTELAELLLENKADVNAQDGSGWTPLHVAASAGGKDMAELLIAHGADINAKTFSGETPLHWAADNGHKDMAKLLLANGADVNITNDFGRTALQFAEDTEFSGGKDIARLLRRHGGHD